MTNTTKTLEELKKEGRLELGGGWESAPEERIEAFADKVWSLALDACREKMPEVKDEEAPSVGLDTGWKARGWNDCRKEILEAIDSLRTGGGKE